MFTSCCFISGHVSASNSFLAVTGISCYGRWWIFLNEAAEKIKRFGLSGGAEGHSRERSVSSVMKRQKAFQGLCCLHHCSDCHLIRSCNPHVASQGCIITRKSRDQWVFRWRCPESEKTSADGADRGPSWFFLFFFVFFFNMIDLNLLNYSLARWKCSCTILLPACESQPDTHTQKVLSFIV